MRLPGRVVVALLLGAIAGIGALPAMAAEPARNEALRSIARAEDERRIADGELLRLLAHHDAGVRARAALAVGRIQDSTTVTALTPLLADTSVAVRREAAFALGQIGHKSARTALTGLLGVSELELRQTALEALGKLGDKAATPRIVEALADSRPEIRGTAAVALWRLADSTAVDALINHMGDPDPSVRWRVDWALEKIVMPDRIVLRAALRLDDPDPLVRAQIARTIGRQKHPRGTAYLLGFINDATPNVVVNGLRALQQIGDTNCVACAEVLLRGLGHADPYVRVTAATVLAEPFAWTRADSMTRRRFADSLAAHLADPDAATRGASARALLMRTGVDAVAKTEPLLADSSTYTRVAVLEALRKLPASAEVARLLLPRLAPGTPLFERMTAADVAGERNEPGAVALLREGLADSSTLYASAAAGGLALANDSTSAGLLAKTYRARAGDAEPDARLSILDALRTLHRTALADSLERVAPARRAVPARFDSTFYALPAETGAVIHTNRGDIEWAFYAREAPQTVRNFVRLARTGYFDGRFVHRVVPNFVIQDGDPSGTGSGGPGYTIRCEYNALHYEAGMVGMALSGKDTGGSQWFITHTPQLHLDGRYTIFARVVRGMDVVPRIVQGDRIERIEILP